MLGCPRHYALCVFCFTGNVAVLDRVFALQVSLLAQGLDAGYRHQPTLVYALSLFTAFEIAGGNVVADLPRYHVQDACCLAGGIPPFIPDIVVPLALHECPTE